MVLQWVHYSLGLNAYSCLAMRILSTGSGKECIAKTGRLVDLTTILQKPALICTYYKTEGNVCDGQDWHGQ